jgi:transcription elongation factor SPT6
MSALRDLIVGEAELDDDEGDESFDEETGEVRRNKKGTIGVNGTNGHFDDSSEEEEDDDEEAAREVHCKGSRG